MTKELLYPFQNTSFDCELRLKPWFTVSQLPACCGYPGGPTGPGPGCWKPPGPGGGDPGNGLPPMPAIGGPAIVWPAIGGPAIGWPAIGGPAIIWPAIGWPPIGGPPIGMVAGGDSGGDIWGDMWGDCWPGDICSWPIAGGGDVWKGCCITELVGEGARQLKIQSGEYIKTSAETL